MGGLDGVLDGAVGWAPWTGAMVGLYVLDERGEPAPAPDLRAWSAAMADARRRTVARDRVGDVEVSTVFTGYDAAWGRGIPLLWETMVSDLGEAIGFWQYASREAALAGHARVLAAVRAGAGDGAGGG